MLTVILYWLLILIIVVGIPARIYYCRKQRPTTYADLKKAMERRYK